MASTTVPSRARLIALLNSIPQAKHLSADRINRWLDAVLSFEPDRVEWHIKRLTGFGGSEIGRLVAERMGEPGDDFFKDSPRDMIAAKLLYDVPTPPNGDMIRGTSMEDAIRDMFRSRYSAEPVQEAFDACAKASFKDHPWLVGNPDDVVLIGGRNWLVDYKCPRPGFAERYDRDGISFDYVAQLHHYRLILEKSGIKVDGMLLCSFDMVQWDVDVRRVDYNPELDVAILEEGDRHWKDYLLAGKLPDFPIRKQVNIIQNQQVSSILNEASRYQLIANVAYGRAEELKKSVADVLGTGRLGGTVIGGALELSAKTVLDVESMANRLLHHGEDVSAYAAQGKIDLDRLVAAAAEFDIDIEKCRLPGDLDPELMAARLEELGEPRARFEVDKLGVRISTTKKGPRAEEVDALKSAAASALDSAINASSVMDEPVKAPKPGA